MFSRSFDSSRKIDSGAAAQQVANGATVAPAPVDVNGPGRMAPGGLAPAPSVATSAPVSGSKVSVIGNDLTILGQGITIISKGSLQLDGAIQGNLHGTEILVGEKGKVDGTIAAQSVIIRGTVNGTIRAQKVALQEGAHVEGEILHQSLTLDARAFFEGRVRRPQNPDDLMPNLDPAAHDTRTSQS